MGKSERTTALLQRHALALFGSQGFDETTVAQIAAAAGVTPVTFFRHFASKDAAVLDDPYDPMIAALVLAQDRSLPARERVRLGLLAGWASLPESAGIETRERIGIVAGNAGLRAGMWENTHRTEDLIVAALVADGTDPLEARVAVGSCLGGLTAALLDWAAGARGVARAGTGAAAEAGAATQGGAPDGAPGGPLGERMLAALELLGR